MKTWAGSHREVLVLGLVGLALTLLPISAVAPAVAGEASQIHRRDVVYPRGEDPGSPRALEGERRAMARADE